jgi:class 3 adenylate cyclase/tetratricopeptide (TPR) repeat protein
MGAMCETCGAELPPEARFCPSCGSQVAGSAATQERKLLTVLFADLVGSTELSRHLDAERARDVLNGFFDAVAAEISSARGQLEKFIGDAVMAVFGLPRVHEEDAVRAVRAGLAIVDRVGRLGQNGSHEAPLQVRVGIETGEAAVGEGPAGQLLVTGAVVNAAARLQTAAAPGEVLVGATTTVLIRDAATLGAARSVRAKGFPDRLVARPVIALARRSVRRTIPLVGRRDELALLRDALDRATRAGRPHLFTVIGDAGMGKSRLVDEFAAVLPEEVVVLTGRGEAHGGATTFGPLADALRRFARISEGAPGDTIRERLAAVIAERCDVDDPVSLARRLAVVLGAGAPEARDDAAGIQDVQRAFVTLVAALAVRAPVVLLFDDLHLARVPVLDLVERLVARRRTAAMRALVVAAGRESLLDDRPTWAGSAWNHTLVRLEPLSSEESGDLARQASGRRLDEHTARHIAERAGGNPFFIIETTGMLLDTPVPDIAHTALPPTVQAVVAARLDRLPTGLRDLARRTSVFLDSFDLEELAFVEKPDLEALAKLEEAEIVVVEDGPARWRFRHQILRDVTYAGLPKRERLRLHLAIADGLDAAGRYGVPDHLERAALAALDLDPSDRTVPDRAADALVVAGDRARRRMEPRRAVDRYQRSLRLSGPREMWGGREARALAGIGEARYWLAEYAQASEALTEAEQLALRIGDDWTLAIALRFLGDVVLNVDSDIDRAEELFTRSLEAAERLGDPPAVSRSLLFAGWVPWRRDRFAEAETLWTRALALGRENRDRWVQSRALTAMSVSRSELDDYTAAATYAQEALRVARDLGDQFSTAVAMVQLGRVLTWQGRQAESLPHFAEAAAIFEEIGARWEYADALYARGRAYEEFHRLAEAEADLRAAVRLAEELGARALVQWASQALVRVAGPREPQLTTTAVADGES